MWFIWLCKRSALQVRHCAAEKMNQYLLIIYSLIWAMPAYCNERTAPKFGFIVRLVLKNVVQPVWKAFQLGQLSTDNLLSDDRHNINKLNRMQMQKPNKRDWIMHNLYNCVCLRLWFHHTVSLFLVIIYLNYPQTVWPVYIEQLKQALQSKRTTDSFGSALFRALIFPGHKWMSCLSAPLPSPEEGSRRR